MAQGTQDMAACARENLQEKVLLTGGLGMLGSHVSRALVASGRRPVIYDSGTDTTLIADVASRCDIVQGNLDDLPRIMNAIKDHKPTAILHFAAQVGAAVDKFPWTALHANLVGTTAMFECARLMGVERVVFPSSKMVYGHVAQRHQHPRYEPVSEEHPLQPLILYAKLKRAAEDMAAHYAQMYGLDIVAFRFGSSFGPGKTGRSKAIPLMGLIESAIARQPFHMECGAEQFDDYCYSGEAANAALAALDAPLQRGKFRAYNIASGELISLGQIVALLKELYPGWNGSAGPGLDYRKIGPGYYFKMDSGKAQQEIGFRPRFDFRSAVLDYAALLELQKVPGPT
jgi:nucleoside-diphosphate-sugar epimerase